MPSPSDRIRELLANHEIVLFLKGTRDAPRCGFSATVVEVLDDYVDAYLDVDVLADADMRDGVKEFTSWPTIPQLFVRGEFVGGSDIVREMADSGELEQLLGRKRKELDAPDVRLTGEAVQALRAFLDDGTTEPIVRIKVSGDFQYAMDFDQPRRGDVVVKGEGYTLLVDRPSARRLDGTVVDYLDRPEGGGFKIDNPNEPPKVRSMTVSELKERMDRNAPYTLFDVRPEAERQIASIPGSIALDERGKALLEDLDRDSIVITQCHHGVRSRAAAEHVLRMGFRNVYNLEGGVDAWSREVDPSVPRY